MPKFQKNFSIKKVALQSIRHGKLPHLDFNHLGEWMLEILRSRRHYKDLEGRWKGQTVFCMGNGPSLNMMDLRLLNGKNVIGTNKAFKLLGKFTPECFDLVIQDSGRLKEIQENISPELNGIKEQIKYYGLLDYQVNQLKATELIRRLAKETDAGIIEVLEREIKKTNE
jgi:hypothetical protein